MPAAPEEELDRADLEVAALYRHRYRTARECGLTFVEASLFADSRSDIGELRHLFEDGCEPAVIAKIVL